MRLLQFLVCCCIPAFLTLVGNAQAISLPEILKLGIEHNLSIQSLSLEQKNTDKKATWLSAGALPDIALRSDLNQSSSNLRQSFANGLEVEQNGVSSRGISAGADLQWVVFDGLGMFFRFKTLKQESKTKAIQLQVEIEQQILTLANSFFKARNLQQKMKIFNALLKSQENQINLAQKKVEAGILPRQTLLQLSIEYNKNKMLWIDIQDQFKQSLIELEEKIGFSTRISEVDSLIPPAILEFPNASENSPDYSSAPQILELKSQAEALKFNLQSTKSRRYPTLTLNSTFQFAQSDNSAGFSLYNQSFGPSVGVGFRMPLLGRGQIQNALRDASVSLSLNNMAQQNLNRLLNLNHQLAKQRFFSLQLQFELATSNQLLSQENMSLTESAFEQGRLSLEAMLLAQQSWLQSQISLEDIRKRILETVLEENNRLGSLSKQLSLEQ
jgi:outer membrane protein TolC